jgi:hypothetical protein
MWEEFMARPVTIALVAAALMGIGIPAVQAGPCSPEIARFEAAVRQSANNPNAGPYARQTIGSQLDREPTPASIKRAQARAWAAFRAEVARAKRLDAKGDGPGCTKALARAEGMYDLH